jgi:uncharacterized protein (DUF362 family)
VADPRSGRRAFLAGLASAAAGLCGCRRRVLPVTPPPPPEDDPGPDASTAARLLEPGHPEEVMPPAAAPREDMLSGISRVKAPEAELIVASGKDPAAMVRLAVEAIGGIRHFVARGSRVVLSPNFAWSRPVRAGITTNPAVVREVIRLCEEAGAREVVCVDYTTDATPRAFRVNGAFEALQGTRARLLSPASAEQHVRIGDFDRGKLHAGRLRWQAVAQELLRCDVLISLPVFKHHREVRVTGAVKKLMGCVWRRAAYHKVDLHGCIAELGSILRPTLVVTDATRLLCSNGPEGPGKVCVPDQVLVSTDPVLADAFACRHVGVEPRRVRYLREAQRLGVGSMELSKKRIEYVTARRRG